MVIKNTYKMWSGTLALLGLILMFSAGITIYHVFFTSKTTLERVIDRGYLKCGINGQLPAFSYYRNSPDNVDDQLKIDDRNKQFHSNAEGFDTDFCRAITVAIFGKTDRRLYFLDLPASKRFAAVRDGDVDVLIRNTTLTASRDTGEGVDFGPIIFHDGQKFMVRANSGITTLEDLRHKKVCVLPGTTTFSNLKLLDIPINLVTKGENQIEFADNSNVALSYLGGRCDSFTSDASQLMGRKSTWNRPDDHLIVPPTSISYEPLAPAVAENDSQWLDVVKYSIWVTIASEQRGFTSTSIDRSFASDVWKNLGLPEENPHLIIRNLGNYGEIYKRHLGPLIPSRQQNAVWQLDNNGRLFTPPLR